MNQNTIQLTLTVKDDGSVVVQQFGKNTEDALGKTGKGVAGATGALDTLKSSWIGITAAVAGAGLAISKAQDYMVLGAKAQQAETSFRTLAAASGEAADQIIANMKRASAGTIDDSQLMQKAVKAMLLEFSGDQITKMTEMARLGARTTGEDVGQAFDKIVDAISTNMPRALRQYGLITKEQMAIANQAMAEGVAEINLLSMATANYNVQLAKTGPLLDEAAEKLQANKVKWEEMKTTMGKMLLTVVPPTLDWAAAIAPAFAFDFDPLINKIKGVQAAMSQVKDETQKVAAVTREEAEENKRQIDAQNKALLGVVAQKKVELETLKALDKDYFKSREDNIKGIAELMKAVGGDEYKITSDSLQKMETLNAEYYTRIKQEIALEADARTKAEKDKVSDLMFTAEKMKTLDAESATRSTTLAQQRTMLSIQTAQNDIKNLTSRLGDYQKYYDSLKVMMDKSTADEKKYQDELKALRQQSIDMNNSAAAQLALINGTGKNQTDQQKYDTGRSTLNSQFMDVTNNLSGQNGQEQFKALQDYMQKVTAFQQQFAQGIKGPADIFGKPQDIMSAAKVAEDASSDINRALGLQQSAVAQLTEEKSKQAQANQTWSQVEQGEAIKTKTAIADIGTTIDDLSAKMEAMKKTIEIRGIDEATSVINGIAARLEQLHDKTVTITMKYAGNASGALSGSTGSDGFTNIPFALDTGGSPVMDSFAVGTPYVPRTGIYQLHRGEMVVPEEESRQIRKQSVLRGAAGPASDDVFDSIDAGAEKKGAAFMPRYDVPRVISNLRQSEPTAENKSGKTGTTFNGDINIVIPANAAPQRPEDWRGITRDYIVPELRKMNA